MVMLALLKIEPLTREAFAPYGDVIEKPGARAFTTNGGQAERHHDPARVAAERPDARTLVSIFHSRPYTLPLQISLMERHPVSSRAFIPINGGRFVVIVGAAGLPPTAKHFRSFVTNGTQGRQLPPRNLASPSHCP